MPKFILDKGGQVAFETIRWGDLDSFTQGYIEALFFTSEAAGVTTAEWRAIEDHAQGSIPGDVGFSDLAPETLAAIIADCAKFQAGEARKAVLEAEDNEELGYLFEGIGGVSAKAGRDFWFTRNGHGRGFWDGDWPEPYATALDEATEAFGEVDVYLGDDGKVYLS